MSSNMGKGRVMIQPKEPHFLRVIIHRDHLLQGKLAIPRRFMQQYGSALSGSVLLKVPSGMTLKVQLIKSGDDIMFGEGWEKFVQYYGIKYGNLIVFRYEESCSFRVIMFDMSATEITYPCSSMNNAGEEDLKRKSKTEERSVKLEEDVYPEFAGESSRSHKEKCREPTCCFRPRNRKSNADKKNVKEEEEDAHPEFINEHPQRRKKKVPIRCFRPKKKTKIKAGVDQKLPKVIIGDQEGEECMPFNYRKKNNGRTGGAKRKKTLTKEKKADALRRATGFKSANPFFKVVLQPAYIERGYLPMQSSFYELHLGKQCVSANLSCPSGGPWPVGFYNSKKFTRITSGWMEFVTDNVLEVGDVCVFELFKDTDISFKVVFFRAAEEAKLS